MPSADPHPPTVPPIAGHSITLTRGPLSRALAGLLLTLVPIAIVLLAVWGLAWLIVERTPLAAAPEWLAWTIATTLAALVAFSVPVLLLIWAARNYKG